MGEGATMDLSVLHIGDMAGVAAVLANETNKIKGCDSEVLQLDTWDRYRIGEYYKNTKYAKSKSELRALVIRKIDSYDHVVIHDMIDFAEDLDGAPLSYVFHGNMLRQQPKLMKRVENISTMENIFVTTEDLLKYSDNAELLVRPVDRKLFKPKKVTSDEAFIMISQRNLPYVKEYLKDFDVDFIIIDNYITPYPEMPKLFSNYGVCVDIKYQPSHPPNIIRKEHSLVALQALSCGLTVYDSGYKEHSTFPIAHEAKRATKEFLRIIKE